MRINPYALPSICALFLLISLAGVHLEAQMNQPEMVTLSGRVIDLTCASKGNRHDGQLEKRGRQSHDARR